jgi:hypothetical protein
MRIFSIEHQQYWLCRHDKFSTATSLIDSYCGQSPAKDLNSAFPELDGFLGNSGFEEYGKIRRTHMDVKIIKSFRNYGKWIVFPLNGFNRQVIEINDEYEVIATNNGVMV